MTQALGTRFDIEPAANKITLVRGDWLVVACDALHEHLDGAELQEAISKSPISASMLARNLVERADQRGGQDNCTVVAAYCT